LTEVAFEYGTVAGLLGAGQIGVTLGQVFSEVRLAPESEPSAIRAVLRSLLESGAQSAAALGGQPFAVEEGGASSALHLAPRPVVTGGAPLGEDEQITHYSNYLSTFKTPVSLRLVAARNYATGEKQLEARLVVVPVRRAFASGETITSSVIDGSATDAQIFNALLALVNAGEVVARGRGVAPLLSPQKPDFYAPGTNEAVFEALRESQMRARSMRVRLVAAEDISTVDNLRIRFILEKAAN
jgi:hypothetical protein